MKHCTADRVPDLVAAGDTVYKDCLYRHALKVYDREHQDEYRQKMDRNIPQGDWSPQRPPSFGK